MKHFRNGNVFHIFRFLGRKIKEIKVHNIILSVKNSY